jgi:D-alanyl-D-alanine carboxypeptidase
MAGAARLALVLLTLQACSSNDSEGPDPGGGRAELPRDSRADLETVLAGVVAEDVAPGASLTVDHPGYRTWSGTAGVANRETRAPLTPEERFRAGSMLKTLVATAVVQLVEQGELELEQTLIELLPAEITERIPAAPAITLRMLLNHTAGLAEFSTAEHDALILANPRRVWSFDELLDRALAEQPVGAPGERFYYSNTGYILLGKVIEVATGEPWRKVIRERVVARAELEHSSLPEEGAPECEGCAHGYHPVDGELVDFTIIDPSHAGAAGGGSLVTTPADLAKFFRALSTGRLFDDEATFDLMLEFVDAPIPEEAQTGYGLGMIHYQVGDIELIGHLGGTAGYQGFVLAHPGTGIVTSGIMNRHGDLGAFILPVIDALGRLP